MKKYLFLTFCSIIVIFETYTTAISIPIVDKNLSSKTKEINEIQWNNSLAQVEESTEINTKENDKVEKVNYKSNTEKDNKTDTVSKKKTEANQNYQIPKQTEPSQNTNTTISSKYSFLKISENIPTENIKAVENEISRLPKKIIDAFYKTNWSISITNEDLSEKYFNGVYNNVRGVTVTGSKMIIIQNKINSIQSSVVHEYGHYLDWYSNYPSSSQEFKKIYNEEVSTFKAQIPNASCVSNEREFFAHTFYYAIKDASKCTPKALNFVQTYVNKIN